MTKRISDSPEREGDKKRRRTDAELLEEIKKRRSLPSFLEGLDPKYFRDLKTDLQNIELSAEDILEMHKVDFLAALALYEETMRVAEYAAKRGKSAYVPSGIVDGDLVVLFMAIGNGDCIFIRTPGGKAIVIDCGSRARPPGDSGDYRKRIRDVLTARILKVDASDEKSELYALVLTHPDQDHYNELVPILEPVIGNIRHLFHSGDLTKYSARPKSFPKESMTTRDFLGKLTTVKNRVTINSKDVKLERPLELEMDLPYDIDEGGKSIRILNEDPDGTCEIVLLAGEVSEESETNREVLAPNTRHGPEAGKTRDRYRRLLETRKHGDPVNAGSIVVLIKAHGRKLLFCGDATYLTEIFLLNSHRNVIRNVDLAQMEHHGSGTAHAGGVYVETINPVFVVASAGTHGGDQNPRWRAVEKYLGLKKLKPGEKVEDRQQRTVELKTGVEAHFVECHDTKGALIPLEDWQPHECKGLYSTRSNGDVGFVLGRDGKLRLGDEK